MRVYIYIYIYIEIVVGVSERGLVETKAISGNFDPSVDDVCVIIVPLFVATVAQSEVDVEN